MNDQLDEIAAEKDEAITYMPAVTTHPAPVHLVHGPQTIIAPRNLPAIRQTIRLEAAEAGEDWYYRFPVKDKKTGKTSYIEGPSIDLTMAVASYYGANDVDCWITSEGPDYLEFTARFLDLQTGFSATRPFRQRKNASKLGGFDQGRRDEITYAIGVSKATRNVIANALKTYCNFAFREARSALVKKIGEDLERYREETVHRITDLVGDIKRVEIVIGRPAHDWLAPDIAKVIAMGTAIKEGMASIDESFPPIAKDVQKTDSQLDELGAKDETQKDQAGPAPDPSAADETAKQSRTASKPAADTPPPYQDTEAIDKMLALASDPGLDVEGRLEAIDAAAPNWEGILEHDQLAKLTKTCVQVAKGYMTLKDARAAMR